MSFNVSLLDATFVALLGILAVSRLAWPQRSQVPLLLVGSAAVIGLGSLRTLVVISAITLGFIYPLHRLIKLAVDREAVFRCTTCRVQKRHHNEREQQ